MCSICNHPDRAEIENAILSLTSDSPPNGLVTIESIAERFDVSLQDLKMHALFHTPMVGDADVSKFEVVSEEQPRESLTRKMKLREADLLSTVGNEYLVTLKTLGRRINTIVQVSPIDVEDVEAQIRCAKMLTKPMVDLYIGLGSEIRQTVKTMAELDRMLNGPEDSLGSGLAALANAIRGSDD